ncbi:hypothetical protein Pint_14264 [Pistacia integerrima]|uniref:Uncharacterized protein n=1 Tax=Pistacia integerrima TaxID=434235 RepID=A0ACC0YC18_9ROSI|nr:hypothetical protein Pint_14264 [Pistacia integerrima]
MATQRSVLLIIGLVISSCFFSVAFALSGTATYYTTYVPSACYGNEDQGVMIAAASDVLWENGAACGRMYRVTCTGATNGVPEPCTGANVTVKIVDYCPGCQGTLDLSQQAFAQIANLVAGIINIDYTQ